MSTCYNCGGEIEFRKVGGLITPIHLSGGCGQESYDPDKIGGFQIFGFSSLKIESYVNPNAHCPVCHAQVFFYQSEDGGRVFFDALGPPWPKHPCTDNSMRFNALEIKAETLTQKEVYKWQRDGWEPFLGTKLEQTEGGITRITGKLKDQDTTWTLYILGSYLELGKHPLFVKPINSSEGKYKIATFKFDNKKGVQELYIDAKLPQSYKKR